LLFEHSAKHFADERIVVSDENRSGHEFPVSDRGMYQT
jgi:hypothetical protein